MSSKKRRGAEAVAETPFPPNRSSTPIVRKGLPWWAFAIAFLVAASIAFEAYGPALNGEFLFDDTYLPFMLTEVRDAPLRAWLGVRPLLMISYWYNYRNSGLEPFAYHAFNVALHVLNAFLIWAVVRRFLKFADESGAVREVLAAFAGGLFLLHPVNTEAVAYVAGRSETLSVFFFLTALALFVYKRGEQISMLRTVAVLLFFGAACTVKEHTTVLPALLLLIDYYFTTPFRLEGIKKNLRLYVPIAIGGALGLVAVWRVLSTAETAGFKLAEFTWYQYLFTQFRVIWTYVRLFILPSDLNGDYYFPVSRTIVVHGAIAGLIALLGVTWAAWKYRREHPLASFGWFGFLILLAPTSSVVPIRDVIVERRLYLPFVCLLLIVVDFVRRWRPSPAMLAAGGAVILVAAGVATHARAQVWSSALLFWEDTAKKSPKNPRAVFQYAYAQWQNGNCSGAAENYGKVARLEKPDDRLLVDWALALDCLNRPDEAVAKLKQAAAIAPSALIEAQVGMIYGKRGRYEEALQALERAEKLDPRFEMTYVYRANIHAVRGEAEAAGAMYRKALSINPANQPAKDGLAALPGARPRG